MVQTLVTWKAVLQEVKQNYPNVRPNSPKFIYLAAHTAEKSNMSPCQSTDLAINLGLKWYPRPTNLPLSWGQPVLCKSYLGQRFNNPNDKEEYVVIMPPSLNGRNPHVIHRTQGGFADPKWFTEVIPGLQSLLQSVAQSKNFSREFNDKVNKHFQNARNGLGMTVGEIQALNLFFNEFVPGLYCDGLCTSCFRVSLPIGGAGERWVHRGNMQYEVRMSAVKPKGKPGQSRDAYVSHTEPDNTGKDTFATWNEAAKTNSFSYQMDQ